MVKEFMVLRLITEIHITKVQPSHSKEKLEKYVMQIDKLGNATMIKVN